MHIDRDDPRSDHDLVSAANDGDRAAFEAIYLRHRAWAANLAYRFTCDRQAALDVMQESFIHLLDRFPGFELRAKLRTYLYPVVRNIALTRRRADARRKFEPLAPHPVAAASEERGSSTPQDLRALEDAVEALPAGQREVILLRFMEDMSLTEIAAAMQLPLGTVKSRLHHAVKALRSDARLKKYEFD